LLRLNATEKLPIARVTFTVQDIHLIIPAGLLAHIEPNIALIKNNANLAAQAAVELARV
jgi:pseudouridine-5'-phosphate glycosidase